MFNEIISDTTTISLELMSGWSSVENGFFFDQDLPMIVSTLRVQLNRSKKEVNKKDLAFLSNREFPIALKPKNKHTKGVKMFYTRDTRQQHNTIKRPRNKFILARTILSKVVKAQSTELTNDDTSRIISWVWKNSTCEFQRYFNYLSFIEEQWHSIYHPEYTFSPKTKTNGTLNQKLKNNSPHDTIIKFNPVSSSRLQNINSKSFGSKISFEDVGDMNRYVQLCASSYDKKQRTAHYQTSTLSSSQNTANYKAHTSKFSIKPLPGREQKNRISSKSEKSRIDKRLSYRAVSSKMAIDAPDVRINENNLQTLIVKRFSSSLFAVLTDDIYLDTGLTDSSDILPKV